MKDIYIFLNISFDLPEVPSPLMFPACRLVLEDPNQKEFEYLEELCFIYIYLFCGYCSSRLYAYDSSSIKIVTSIYM